TPKPFLPNIPRHSTSLADGAFHPKFHPGRRCRMTQHLNGMTWAAFRAHLHRGGAFAYWWTLDETTHYTIKDGDRAGEQEKCKHTIWWPIDKPLPIPNGATEHI